MRPSNPRFWLSITILVAAVAGIVVAGWPRAAPPPPHLLLISVDTLRRDALRAFDPAAAPLPAFDELAARSARFAAAYSPAAWTLPAHASLLTGLYPDRHGAVHRAATLAGQAPTLAEALAARGYETVAFTDGGYLDADYGLARGFDRYDGVGRDGAPAPEWLPRGGEPPAVRGHQPFSRAIAHLEHRGPREPGPAPPPLFLFVHTYALHDYFYADPGGKRGDARPSPEMRRNMDCLLGKTRCSEAQWRGLRELYAGELRELDGQLAELLHTARERLADRPLWVVLTSDHGEGFDPAGGSAHHGGALRPELLAVPLLVAGPGIEPRDLDTPVSLVDVAPTLLELAGASRGSAGPELDGLSLLPLTAPTLGNALRRRALADRTLEAQEHYYWWTEGGGAGRAAPPRRAGGGERASARDVPERPFAVAVTRDGWWLWRGMGGEEVLRVGVGGEAAGGAGSGGTGTRAPGAGRDRGDRDTIAALRRHASRLMREAPASSARPEEDRAREEMLESLGYLGDGR